MNLSVGALARSRATDEPEAEATAEVGGIDRQVPGVADGRAGPPEEIATDPSLVLDRLAEVVAEAEQLAGRFGPPLARDPERAGRRVGQLGGRVARRS